MKKILILFALGALLEPAAYSGVRLKLETRDKDGGLLQTGTLDISDADRLRMDIGLDASGENPKSSSIFRGDLEAVIMIDHANRSFVRMDKQMLDSVAAQLINLRQTLMDRIKDLPEDQRAKAEQYLQKNLPSQSDEGTASFETRSVGRDGELEKYEVWYGENKQREIWVSDLTTLGVSARYLPVFEKMSRFYENILKAFSSNPAFSSAAANPFVGFSGINGFPVRIREFESGNETSVSTVGETELTDADFEPPTDYQEMRLDRP